LEEQPNTKLWTPPFLVLTLCNLLLFLNLQMILPSLPTYVKEQFHASGFTVSLVTSLFALTAIVARIFAGQALQKGKRNLILFAGLAIATLATVGYAACASVALILLMRVLFGVGFGMASTTFPTMASNVIPAKRMGEGMGYFGLSTSIAMSVGPMIGLGLLGTFGFGTLITVATVTAAVVFPLAYSMRKLPMQKVAGKSKIFDRKLLLPFTLNFLLSITYGGLLSFLALFGKETGIANVGNFFLFNALAVLAVRPISGKLFDRRGHIAVLVPGAVLVIIGLMVLSYATTMTGLTAAAVCYGLGFGVLQPSIQAWMIKEVSPEQRGVANGMFLNSIDLGVAIGSMLLGTLAASTSYAVMYRVSTLCLVAFLLVYSVYLVTTLSRQKVRG
jgi:MFS family permease